MDLTQSTKDAFADLISYYGLLDPTQQALIKAFAWLVIMAAIVNCCSMIIRLRNKKVDDNTFKVTVSQPVNPNRLHLRVSADKGESKVKPQPTQVEEKTEESTKKRNNLLSRLWILGDIKTKAVTMGKSLAQKLRLGNLTIYKYLQPKGWSTTDTKCPCTRTPKGVRCIYHNRAEAYPYAFTHSLKNVIFCSISDKLKSSAATSLEPPEHKVEVDPGTELIDKQLVKGISNAVAEIDFIKSTTVEDLMSLKVTFSVIYVSSDIYHEVMRILDDKKLDFFDIFTAVSIDAKDTAYSSIALARQMSAVLLTDSENIHRLCGRYGIACWSIRQWRLMMPHRC